MNILCIITKSGVGKSTLIENLESIGKKLNIYPKKKKMKIYHNVRSFTTRDIRKDDPRDINTHIFVNDEYWNANKDKAMAVYHSPKGYTSWTSKESFDKDSINLYAIDPIAFVEFRKKYRRVHNIYAIYLSLDESIRKERLESRGDIYTEEDHLDIKHLSGLRKSCYSVVDASEEPYTLAKKVDSIARGVF